MKNRPWENFERKQGNTSTKIRKVSKQKQRSRLLISHRRLKLVRRSGVLRREKKKKGSVDLQISDSRPFHSLGRTTNDCIPLHKDYLNSNFFQKNATKIPNRSDEVYDQSLSLWLLGRMMSIFSNFLMNSLLSKNPFSISDIFSLATFVSASSLRQKHLFALAIAFLMVSPSFRECR